MKNLKLNFEKLVIAIIFCGMLIFFQACQESTTPETNRISEEMIDQMKKDHIIPLDDAVKMYKKYAKDRVDVIKDSLKKKYKDPKFKDTRNIWINLQSLKTYIQYIEGVSKDSIEGLQFYLSVYPNNKEKNKNHQTFFIAPTIPNTIDGGSETIQSGFTIVDGKMVFLRDAFKSYKSEDGNMEQAGFFMRDHHEGTLYNRNDPSPPNGND